MPEPRERSDISLRSEKAVLAAVRVPASRYDERDPFGELAALAEQAGATVVGTLEQRLDRPVAGTFMGSGKLEELKGLCRALDATTVIFDHELSPKQIAKIEQVVEAKILDRSEVILDIFASRATTHEAKLQVEIAQLDYTYPRLRAMWSHLERIVGGSPMGIGTRGPGEQQLEIDRRIVQRRRQALVRELRDIESRKSRSVQDRNARHVTVGLVGYTNAGKSTLFNTLTMGGAYADDRLFATLMTRTRDWDLGGGESVMLSDTVGFVRDLPHNLVASFRATLEEATHAHLLLVVLDVSDPASELHYETVERTLDEVFDDAGVPEKDRPPRVVLLNKSDRLEHADELLVWQSRVPGSIAISALANEDGTMLRGHDELKSRVLAEARGPEEDAVLRVPLRSSKIISVLENRASVLDRSYENADATMRVRIGRRLLERVLASGEGVTRTDGRETNPEGWDS